MSRAHAVVYQKGRSKQLRALAEAINAEHRAAYGHARKAVEHAAECGQRLIEAKALVSHGGWLRWLEQNTEVGARQCQKYMRLAEGWAEIEAKSEPGSHLSINDALRLIAEPKCEDEVGEPEPEATPRDIHAAKIGASWDTMRAHLRGFARTAGEMRKVIQDDKRLSAALMLHANVGKAMAEKIPQLLAEQADEAEWIEAFLADGEALCDSYTPPNGNRLLHGTETDLHTLRMELQDLKVEVETADQERLPQIIDRCQEIQLRTYAIRRAASEAAAYLHHLADQAYTA